MEGNIWKLLYHFIGGFISATEAVNFRIPYQRPVNLGPLGLGVDFLGDWGLESVGPLTFRTPSTRNRSYLLFDVLGKSSIVSVVAVAARSNSSEAVAVGACSHEHALPTAKLSPSPTGS